MSRSRLGVVLLLLFLGLLLGIDIRDEYEQHAQREQERLSSLAAALHVNIGEQLRATSRMLDTLRQDIPSLLADRDGRQRLDRRMHLLTQALIGVRTMVYVNPDGDIVSSNRPELIGRNFRDQERYKNIRDSGDVSTLFISRPFTTPLGTYTVSLGKALLDGQGKFDGYLLAVLDPEYFSILFRSLIYAPDMRLSVAHGDGTIFYSTQETPDIRGVNVAERQDSVFNRHLASGGKTSFHVDRATATKDVRYIAIDTVWPASGQADKPLVVAVSRDRAAIFQAWKTSTAAKILLFIGLTISLIIGDLALSRRKRDFLALYSDKEKSEQEADRKIRDSNTLFRAYFDNMAVGAVQLDAGGYFQLVNERYCEMTGYRRDELIGRMKPADITHPEDRTHEQLQRQAFLGGNGKDLELEKRTIRKDGQVIWVQVSTHAVRDTAGEVKFTTAVVEDITERKRMLTELQEAREAAEVANRAKTLFLGNMSHEMRTPLHQISGIARLFRRDMLSEKQTQRLELLDNAVKRMDNVIGGILTLVDIDSRSTTIRLGPVDFHAIVGNTVALLAGSAEQKGLHLEQQVAALPDKLLGDVRHLTTILACFGNNAITYTNQGRVSIRVSCDATDAASAMIRIEVEDQGIGIAPENLARLFEHFEQVDNSHTRQFGGTGVGLAIVRKLASLMGGDAGCRSTLGQGSTFWATVKLAKAG